FNLFDLINATTGTVFDYVDSERVNYFARGFQIDAIQFDGATAVTSSGGGSYIQSDTAVLDHAEVIRGATGLMRGSGKPSGAVNLVRKRRTREAQYSAEASFGSWDNQRYVVDASTPLTSDGGVRSRAVLVYQDKDFFQRAREEERQVGYLVLDADIT